MSFTDILLLKKVTHSVISITAALVALLGGWIVISAVTSEPETRYVLPPQAGGSITNASRAPQSIGVGAMLGLRQSNIETSQELKVETFNLGCINRQNAGVTLNSVAKQVRIKAKFCDGKTSASNESSIVNRTNGYVATLFNLERGEFTSDYISLAEGQNQIIFQISDEQGSRSTADVTIFRR